MKERDTSGRGVLLPEPDSERLRSAGWRPSDDLAEVVEALWFAWWSLGDGTRDIRTLPGPHLQIVFEPGASSVLGISTRRFARTLSGEGIVFGVKLRPAMWAAFSEVDASELTDRRVPLGEVTGIDPAAVEERLRALLSGGDPRAVGPCVEALLRGAVRSVDPAVARAAGWVELVERTPAITSVDQLVARAGVHKRSVQRAFQRYVGVPPKWVIRRFRLHEAIERVGKGEYEGFAQLATELGYADQAHFSRDFVEATGHTPKAYVAASF